FITPFATAAAPTLLAVFSTVFLMPLSFCFLITDINPNALRTKPKVLATAPLVNTKGTALLMALGNSFLIAYCLAALGKCCRRSCNCASCTIRLAWTFLISLCRSLSDLICERSLLLLAIFFLKRVLNDFLCYQVAKYLFT